MSGLGLVLGGCAGVVIGEDGRVTGTQATGAQASAAPPARSATVRRGSGRLGGGRLGSGPAACTRPIAEFEQVLINDQRIGYLNSLQHGSIMAELEPARSACAAGRVREANRTLAAVRTRHRYR